jgi:nicotinate-nucleotide adenylyltransferase
MKTGLKAGDTPFRLAKTIGLGIGPCRKIEANARLRRVKIGFLGGSFDPVHFGHLMAAQDAFEQCGLDRLIFVPAAQAPLKPTDVQSSSEDRMAMMKAAVDWDKRFEISDFELSKGGVSFTIDSARHFRALYPDDELFWVIGGDQLPKLHLWKDIEELATLVEFIFLERPGYPVKARVDIPGLRLRRCDGHLLAISSTELRERTRLNLALDYFVPHKAIVYIREKGLYRDKR